MGISVVLDLQLIWHLDLEINELSKWEESPKVTDRPSGLSHTPYGVSGLVGLTVLKQTLWS